MLKKLLKLLVLIKKRNISEKHYYSNRKKYRDKMCLFFTFYIRLVIQKPRFSRCNNKTVLIINSAIEIKQNMI